MAKSNSLLYLQFGKMAEKTPEQITGEMLQILDQLEKETQEYDECARKQVKSENDFKKKYAEKYIMNKHTGDNKKTINEIESQTVIDTYEEKIQADLDKVLADVQKQKIKNCSTKLDVYRSLLSYIKADKDYCGQLQK